jgi:hypothetical protein
MDGGGKWRCLRHGDALAFMQWLLCRTETLCGSQSVQSVARSSHPSQWSWIYPCLSEAVLMASGSWHRDSELFLGYIHHVRIPETHQLCFWM